MQKINRWKFILNKRSLFVIVIVIIIHSTVNAEDIAAPEYNLKAAFLYNFAKFVTWPHDAFASPEAPLTLCVLGNNSVGSALKLLDNKRVRERGIATELYESVEFAKKCHILYISSSAKNKISDIVSALQGIPVLTVSSSDKSIHSGVMIELIKVGENIKFSVNLKAAVNSHLKISSKLLNLAQTVIKD